MKQKFVSVLIAAIVSATAIAQTSPVSNIINGPAFESIVVSGPISVELIESENAAVEALGNYDFINNTNIRWSKNQLHISFTKNFAGDGKPIKVYVKKLTNIIAEDGARVNTPKPLHCGNIWLQINGESYARIMNYGGINVTGDENVSVRNFTYSPGKD
jgi:hypothetical protein